MGVGVGRGGGRGRGIVLRVWKGGMNAFARLKFVYAIYNT